MESDEDKKKPEPYRQDELLAKIKLLESEIEKKLGRKVLDEIYSYSFRHANQQAKEFGIDTIEDEFSRKALFSKIYRFKMEYAILEVADCIEYLKARGYDAKQIRDYFIPGRISEVVCFE
jgi:hypothetical protein